MQCSIHFAASTAAILLLLIVGCEDSSKPTMFTVKGTATIDGTPIEKGSIVLDPKDGQGTPVSGAIANGEFEFEAPPGEKIVRISASEATAEKDEYGQPIDRSLVPEKYNRKSTLTETVTEGENSFKFDLLTKE